MEVLGSETVPFYLLRDYCVRVSLTPSSQAGSKPMSVNLLVDVDRTFKTTKRLKLMVILKQKTVIRENLEH